MEKIVDLAEYPARKQSQIANTARQTSFVPVEINNLEDVFNEDNLKIDGQPISKIHSDIEQLQDPIERLKLLRDLAIALAESQIQKIVQTPMTRREMKYYHVELGSRIYETGVRLSCPELRDIVVESIKMQASPSRAFKIIEAYYIKTQIEGKAESGSKLLFMKPKTLNRS